jgi:hypothetical protein
MADQTGAWVLARLLRGHPTDGIDLAILPEPYAALAIALRDRRNGQGAQEILEGELQNLPAALAKEISAAVLAVDPLAPAPRSGPDEEIDVLDAAPATIRRPLTLVGGHAYAATWVSVRVTEYVSKDKLGNRVQHKTPVVSDKRALVVVRDDGALFANMAIPKLGARSMHELGLTVSLSAEAPPDKVWSGLGVKRFLAGEQPNPVDVFDRVVSVIDRFVDFDRSLADQRTMADLVACYVLESYFLDALDVAGYLWPNGDRGSGKTTMLHVVSELGYLGQLILAGGTYAALRDLSDYGAVLAFDDAESLAGGKRNEAKIDPDKRALLLAGNRRGSFVPLKELTPQKTWQTRYVSTFCPRLFSAIQLPDPVLASRSIVVPLIPTADRGKSNVSPADYSAWPCDRNRLIDDLWAMGLAYLPELPAEAESSKSEARLSSRALEPWQGVLAVAHWLSRRGLTDLFARMEALSMAYQRERSELETFNPAIYVIRALLELGSRSFEDPLTISASQIAAAVKEMTDEGEREEDEGGVKLSTRRVGMLFGQWRIKRLPRPHNRGPRHWSVSRRDLGRLSASFGLAADAAQSDDESSDDDGSAPKVPLAPDAPDWQEG